MTVKELMFEAATQFSGRRLQKCYSLDSPVGILTGAHCGYVSRLHPPQGLRVRSQGNPKYYRHWFECSLAVQECFLQLERFGRRGQR